MTDKNKNMGDEYQFPHDEYVAAEEETQHADHDNAFHGQEDAGESDSVAEPKAKKGLLQRFPILQNKRVLIVVGVAVVAIIGFQIMKPSHTVKVIKTAEPAQPTPQLQGPSLQQQQQSALLNKMNNISQTAANTQNVENQLTNEVSQLKTSLNESAQSNKTMREALVALADQVQHLSAEVKKATTAPRHIKKLPPAPVLKFHLRAIIPGRAWIEGSNGESDSVAVGNTVKNYGKVTAIDVNTGKVFTSSGKVITYNGDGN